MPHKKAPSVARPARGPGRPREFDVDEALDRAIHVFRQRGYEAASVSELCKEMDLTRGSVYKAFSDKAGMFAAAHERYLQQRHADQEQALSGAVSARAKLQALLERYAELSSGEEGRVGCLVVATATQLSVVDESVAARIQASFGRLRQRLRQLIREGHADGSIPASVDESRTAEALLALLEGMRVIGKSAPRKATMLAIVQTAMQWLD